MTIPSLVRLLSPAFGPEWALTRVWVRIIRFWVRVCNGLGKMSIYLATRDFGYEGKISTPLGCQQVSLDWKVHCYHHLWYEGCQSSLLGMEEQAMVHVT